MKEYVKSKYLEFSDFEGSQHIAGEFAILQIMRLAETFNVKSILEIGLGIGTLPSTILSYFKRPISYIGTEANEFCLKSLKTNLDPEIYGSLTVYNSVSCVKRSAEIFDLVIVDGGFDTFQELIPKLHKHAIIAIEGDRKDQEEVIRNYFAKSKFVHIVSDLKNDPQGVFKSTDWQGGIKVIFVNPTVKQNVFWFKEKLRSKRVYSLRRKYNK